MFSTRTAIYTLVLAGLLGPQLGCDSKPAKAPPGAPTDAPTIPTIDTGSETGVPTDDKGAAKDSPASKTAPADDKGETK